MKRAMIVLGVVLCLAGVVGLLHPEFTYHQNKELARVGPVQATVDDEETVSVPRGVSILLLVAGAGLAFFAARAKKPNLA